MVWGAKMIALLKLVEGKLAQGGSNESEREAKLIISHILGISPATIPFYEGKWQPEHQESLVAMLAQRLKGEPLQYILGETEFMSLPFKVTKNVLIPRPDTECVVEEAITLLKGIDKPQIADICTGSGAIAVSLACYLPHAAIWATDISKDSLQIATENGLINGVGNRIAFKQGNLFEPLKQLRFDLVISNPPYIPRGELSKLQKEVQKEPVMALDGGLDGLEFYRQIIPLTPLYLKTGGFLILETGSDQKEAISHLLEKDFLILKYIQDLAGRQRGILARLKPANH